MKKHDVAFYSYKSEYYVFYSLRKIYSVQDATNLNGNCTENIFHVLESPVPAFGS